MTRGVSTGRTHVTAAARQRGIVGQPNPSQPVASCPPHPFNRPFMPPPGIQSPLPLAVHVFRRPLPYAQTLRLQDAIFALRSAARKTKPEGELARRDVLLLLGTVAP